MNLKKIKKTRKKKKRLYKDQCVFHVVTLEGRPLNTYTDCLSVND